MRKLINIMESAMAEGSRRFMRTFGQYPEHPQTSNQLNAVVAYKIGAYREWSRVIDSIRSDFDDNNIANAMVGVIANRKNDNYRLYWRGEKFPELFQKLQKYNHNALPGFGALFPTEDDIKPIMPDNIQDPKIKSELESRYNRGFGWWMSPECKIVSYSQYQEAAEKNGDSMEMVDELFNTFQLPKKY